MRFFYFRSWYRALAVLVRLAALAVLVDMASTVISPIRQILQDHRHCPRSRRGVAPTIERRMGSS